MMPVDRGSHLEGGDSTPFEDGKLYQTLTGSLTYTAMSTQPDIGYVMQYLSQLNMKPSRGNWAAAKCVLHYLKGTKDMGLVY